MHVIGVDFVYEDHGLNDQPPANVLSLAYGRFTNVAVWSVGVGEGLSPYKGNCTLLDFHFKHKKLLKCESSGEC